MTEISTLTAIFKKNQKRQIQFLYTAGAKIYITLHKNIVRVNEIVDTLMRAEKSFSYC